LEGKKKVHRQMELGAGTLTFCFEVGKGSIDLQAFGFASVQNVHIVHGTSGKHPN
jgi:hypothetical protein